MPPLAAGAHQVEEPVQQVPDVRRARPPAGLGGRDQRLEQPELVICQGLAGAEVPNQCAISGRPHGGLQPGNRPQRRPRGQDQPVNSAPSPLRKPRLRCHRERRSRCASMGGRRRLPVPPSRRTTGPAACGGACARIGSPPRSLQAYPARNRLRRPGDAGDRSRIAQRLANARPRGSPPIARRRGPLRRLPQVTVGVRPAVA